MLPAHIPLALSAHFRPGLALLASGNGEKPRLLPATWAFFHLPAPEPISFSISRLYHKSSLPKGPKRPTFSPCGIFIQSPLLALPFTGIQRRSGVATLEWARSPRCTAGVSPASFRVPRASLPVQAPRAFFVSGHTRLRVLRALRGEGGISSHREGHRGRTGLGGPALPSRLSPIEYCRGLNALACRRRAWFNGRDGCCEGGPSRFWQKEGFSARVNSSCVRCCFPHSRKGG